MLLVNRGSMIPVVLQWWCPQTLITNHCITVYHWLAVPCKDLILKSCVVLCGPCGKCNCHMKRPSDCCLSWRPHWLKCMWDQHWFCGWEFASSTGQCSLPASCAASFPPGAPISNLEYLLSVLPKVDAHLVPDSLQVLMSSDDSPVAALYPSQYRQDIEGGRNEVILLEHFDVDKLIEHFRMADLRVLDYGGQEALVEKDTPASIMIVKYVQGEMELCSLQAFL